MKWFRNLACYSKPDSGLLGSFMGAAIGGALFFNQSLSKLNVIGMAIIIVGVVVMNLGGTAH